MNFRCFHAPENEMKGLLDGDMRCDLCARIGTRWDPVARILRPGGQAAFT
jgi:hypothetical protein